MRAAKASAPLPSGATPVRPGTLRAARPARGPPCGGDSAIASTRPLTTGIEKIIRARTIAKATTINKIVEAFRSHSMSRPFSEGLGRPRQIWRIALLSRAFPSSYLRPSSIATILATPMGRTALLPIAWWRCGSSHGRQRRVVTTLTGARSRPTHRRGSALIQTGVLSFVP